MVIDRDTDNWLDPMFKAADRDDVEAVWRETAVPPDWVDFGYRLRKRIGWDDRHPDHPDWPLAHFTRYKELKALGGRHERRR